MIQVGYEIQWGDPNALIRLVEQIGKKEGFGSIFCDGTSYIVFLSREKVRKNKSFKNNGF